MSVTAEKKAEIIKKFQQDKNDTGSPQVQIAILTERINNLTEHMKQFSKDFHSRRGLLGLVSKRRKLLDYLKRNDSGAYEKLIAVLGIRK